MHKGKKRIKKETTKQHGSQRKKTRPDDAAGAFVSINFGQNVSEDVADGEEDRARIKRHADAEDAKAPVHDFCGGGDVADDEDRNKDTEDDVEKTVGFGHAGDFTAITTRAELQSQPQRLCQRRLVFRESRSAPCLRTNIVDW